MRSPAIVWSTMYSTWSVWACQTGKCYHVLIMHKLMGEGMLCTNVVVGPIGQYWPLTLQSVARSTYLSNGTCTPRVNPDQFIITNQWICTNLFGLWTSLMWLVLCSGILVISISSFQYEVQIFQLWDWGSTILRSPGKPRTGWKFQWSDW